MNQKSLFLQFWKHEAVATRKVISRIPQEKSDYRPDPESRTAREIAWLIVLEERLLVDGLETGMIDWRDEPTPATVEVILNTYDGGHDDATSRLDRLDESAWEGEVGFVVAGQEIRRATGYEYAWEFLFDQVHHRGQLSTYLRPMGARVPSIYGPSGDEAS
ncbi:MAG: DinB family protein [Acidobacteriota bacterium]|nr:DinB family protein [Acidobacteriota bacterium]